MFDVALADSSMARVLFDRVMKEDRFKEAIALALVQKNREAVQEVADKLNICSESVNAMLGSEKY